MMDGRSNHDSFDSNPLNSVLVIVLYRVPLLTLGYILISSLLPEGGSGGLGTDIQRRNYTLAWEILAIM